MKAVDIFLRVDRLEDLTTIDLIRQRKLNKYPVNIRTGVQCVDNVEKLGVRRRIR